MSFPDRIERTLELAHPPERVWAALTTAEGLGTWFGNRAESRPARRRHRPSSAWDTGDNATLHHRAARAAARLRLHLAVYGLPDGRPAAHLRGVHPGTRPAPAPR